MLATRSKMALLAGAAMMTCLSGASALAADVQTPPMSPLMQQLNNGNWLPEQEAQNLSDELFYQDAIQAYITSLPLMNTIGLRDGSEAAFGKGYNVLFSMTQVTNG